MACCMALGASAASSISSSPSVMSGTVGRERPWAMGAWVRGVFWGVGAVGSTWLMGMLTDMAASEKERWGGERERKGGRQR